METSENFGSAQSQPKVDLGFVCPHPAFGRNHFMSHALCYYLGEKFVFFSPNQQILKGTTFEH